VKINPPRFAIWLLSLRLRDEWRDFVVGDLEEEFATRSGDSRLAARAWFWWQTMRCLVAPPAVRPHTRQLERLRGDSTMRSLIADVRYALRVMSRTPSFAVAVIGVMALRDRAKTSLQLRLDGVVPFGQSFMALQSK